ncbi:uncharacterized protein LOC111324308 [Stylophora pistillata]|uniref:uncharacterized protein LOC111324308 n=1 Tax=Stylophora pistillata TaxID=50429 RepID=UPI000C04B8BE|nr:uncharacterized protein LOC111324308 [Stylophora pistillata]
MEQEALSLEDSGSITYDVSISSINGNGQSGVYQKETQCQEHDTPDSLEGDEEETLKDKNMMFFNGPKSEGVVNYGFFDLEEEDEIASSEGSQNLLNEKMVETENGEGGITIRTTSVTTILRHVDRSGTKIEIPESLNEEEEEEEEEEQAKETNVKELLFVRNEKQTTSGLPHEDSTAAVEKKTITYHTKSITVNGVTLESKESMEDDIKVIEKNDPELFSIKSKSEEVENVQGENEKDPIEDDALTVLEDKSMLPHMGAVLNDGETDGVRQSSLESALEIIEEIYGSRQLSQVSNENEGSEFREPLEEVSLVAKEVETRSSHYHPLLVEKDEKVECDEKVHVDIVQIDKDSTVIEFQKGQETETEAADTMIVMEEESPLVVQKRPPSLHLETVFDYEEDHGTREEKVETPDEETEKKPVSHSMEEVRQLIDEASPEVIERRPVSIHMENVFSETDRTEVLEPVKEAYAVATESEPRSFHYHQMLEEIVDEGDKGDNFHESFLEVKAESAAAKSEKDLETTNYSDSRQVVAEESPFVVEKRPVSLHMEAIFEKEESEKEPIAEVSPEVVEKRPVSLHMEHLIGEGENNEVREPIKEESTVAVESEPRSFVYHTMLEEKAEDKDDDNSVEVGDELVDIKFEKGARNETVEMTKCLDTRDELSEEPPLVVEKRPVSLHMEATFELEENGEVRQTVEEASLEVIEKRPSSLHVEHLFDEDESTEVREGIEEVSTVAVESEPRLLCYHSILEEKLEDQDGNVDDGDKSVDIGNELVTIKFKNGNGKETAEMIKSIDTKDEISEEPHLVVEKRPVSLHMEAGFELEENDEVRQKIEEASPEVIEKRPVSLHMEYLFDKGESTEDREPIEEVSTFAVESEPRFFVYHSMLEERVEEKDDDQFVRDGDELIDIKYKKDAGKDTAEMTKSPDAKDEITEGLPLVVEKQPVSLNVEAAFVLEENDEVRKTVEEASPEVVEKRPVSLHMEQLFDDGKGNEAPESIEEESYVALESELRSFCYHPMLEEKIEDENKNNDDKSKDIGDELVTIKRGKGPKEETEQTTKAYETESVIFEELPLVVEKQPVSLQLEPTFAFNHGEEDEVRQTAEEASSEVVEKRPVSLHMEHLFGEGKSSDIQKPVEETSTIVVKSEPRSFSYHPMLEEAEEPEEDKNGDVISIELPTRPRNDDGVDTNRSTPSLEMREVIVEDSLTVLERRPVSLHMDAVFDKEEEHVRNILNKDQPEVIEKKPVSSHEEKSLVDLESIEQTPVVAVETAPKSFNYHPMLEVRGDVEEEDEAFDENSVKLVRRPIQGKEIHATQSTDINEAIAEESPLVIEKRPVSLHMEAVFDGGEDDGNKPVEDNLSILIQEKATEQKEPVTEAELVVMERKTATLQSKVLLDHETPGDEFVDDTEEDNDATVESLLINIESIVEKPSPGHPDSKVVKLAPTSDKEPVEEETAVKVEKRRASLNMESLLDPEISGEQLQESDTQEKREAVDEVVAVIVQKKPISQNFLDEQEADTQETESVCKEETRLVVLDIPQVEKKKEGEDSIKETAAPVVQKNEVEFHSDLLELEGEEEQKQKKFDVAHSKQEVNNNWQDTKQTEFITTTTSVVTSIESTDEQSAHDSETIVTKTVYEKTTLQVASSSTNSLPNTVTTEEMLSPTSYTKQFHEGNTDGEVELLRVVLRRRLSAPEILPEKENEGSAPLAVSEDRGILESQEQFNVAESPRKLKESTLPNRTQGVDESEMEPYTDIPLEEKLIPDSPREAEAQVAHFVEKEEGTDETLPVLMLLSPENRGEEKERKKAKKGGLSSPQCKCCSVM